MDFITVDMKKKTTKYAPIKLESNNGLNNDKYTIAMARTQDPNSATGQFFINVVDNPRLDALREDKLFWTYLEAGSIDAALNQYSFVRIIQDDDFREDLRDLGLVDESAASSPREFRKFCAETFRSVSPRLRTLRNDPELKELMANPDIVSMLESGNTLGLLSHSDFRRVVSRVAAGT